MNLENTLRELLNEMKMPMDKPPLPPTVHTGPVKPPLPPTVHTGPEKPPVPSHPNPKPKKPSEITSSTRRLEETLVEYYKQRLLEEGLLGRLGRIEFSKKLQRAGEAVGAMIRNPSQLSPKGNVPGRGGEAEAGTLTPPPTTGGSYLYRGSPPQSLEPKIKKPST